MVCKLCGEDAPLIKAHVVPEAFFRKMSSPGDRPVSFPLRSGEHPKRRPVGIYDPALVCAACEALFGPWDQYGFEFFYRPIEQFQLLEGTYAKGLLLTHDVNYAKLKLFVLSVLWRAHSTTAEEFKGVDVGPYEPALRNLILQADPGQKQDFPVMLTRYTDRPGDMFTSPYRTRVDGVFRHLFHFGGHDVSVFVGKGRPEQLLYDHVILAPDTPLIMLVASIVDGPKTDQLRRALLESERLRADRQANRDR